VAGVAAGTGAAWLAELREWSVARYAPPPAPTRQAAATTPRTTGFENMLILNALPEQ
jgi:hypothetical protein